jgi:hypothetical protein
MTIKTMSDYRCAHGAARRAWKRSARWLHCDSGQELVEFALVLPMLFILILGLIEAGNAYSLKHKISVLSREGANLASRGSTLPEALDAVMASGSDILLADQGGAVASRVVVESGSPVVKSQAASPGYEARSRLGLPDSAAVTLAGLGFPEGQVIHAVEVFVEYRPLTPFAKFFASEGPQQIYERAIF